jgi:DNA polymerase-4
LPSKICSDLAKPDGLTLLEPRDYAHLAAAGQRQRHGPKATVKPAALGIHTIAMSRRRSGAALRSASARAGSYHDASHGRDDRPVVTSASPLISRETTFDRDLHACAIGRARARVHAAVRTTRR